jgi:hypothetical protein
VAAARLVEAALLEIRTMAAKGEVVLVDQDADPDSPFDTEVLARVYLLADICHQLAPALAEQDPVGRETLAAEALASRGRVAVPAARRWLTGRLARLGPEAVALIGDPS